MGHQILGRPQACIVNKISFRTKDPYRLLICSLTIRDVTLYVLWLSATPQLEFFYLITHTKQSVLCDLRGSKKNPTTTLNSHCNYKNNTFKYLLFLLKPWSFHISFTFSHDNNHSVWQSILTFYSWTCVKTSCTNESLQILSKQELQNVFSHMFLFPDFFLFFKFLFPPWW